MTDAPLSIAAIRWREKLSQITHAKGPRVALDAAAQWLAALEAHNAKKARPKATTGRARVRK